MVWDHGRRYLQRRHWALTDICLISDFFGNKLQIKNIFKNTYYDSVFRMWAPYLYRMNFFWYQDISRKEQKKPALFSSFWKNSQNQLVFHSNIFSINASSNWKKNSHTCRKKIKFKILFFLEEKKTKRVDSLRELNVISAYFIVVPTQLFFVPSRWEHLVYHSQYTRFDHSSENKREIHQYFCNYCSS